MRQVLGSVPAQDASGLRTPRKYFLQIEVMSPATVSVFLSLLPPLYKTMPYTTNFRTTRASVMWAGLMWGTVIHT